MAAFWRSCKAIKEEEIVRRKHNYPTHAYRGCEKEKRRHAYQGTAKVTIGHADRGSKKKKEIRSRYFESESVVEI